MKFSLIFTLIFLSAVLYANAGIGDLNEFKAVSAISGGLKIEFRDKGVRFNYKIGDEERKLSSYNGSVNILFDHDAEFAAKDLKILFKPMSSSNSFTVEKELDLRSMGGGLTKKVFSLTVQEGIVVYGDAIMTTQQ